jgi:hypothetical protein
VVWAVLANNAVEPSELPYDSAMSKTSLCALCWLLLCGSAVGQDGREPQVYVTSTVYSSRHLSGVVTDTVGTLIPDAKVQVSKGDVELAEVTTDRKGSFLFKKLNTGEYELSVQAFAFRTVRYHVVIVIKSGKREEPIHITLHLAPLVPHVIEITPQ